MSEAKYRYNKKNLSYEKIEYGFVDNLRKFLSYLFVGTIFAAVILFITYTFYNSPKEKILKSADKIRKEDYNKYRQVFLGEAVPSSGKVFEPEVIENIFRKGLLPQEPMQMRSYLISVD